MTQHANSIHSFHIQLFTLFPEMFPGPLGHSLSGKALEKKLWSYQAINIRDYAKDTHKIVDDEPYGGGAGMVIRPDVLGAAIDDQLEDNVPLIYLSPRGVPLTQKKLYSLAKLPKIAIICGRFEGIDQRVIDHYKIEEVSVGDYVLSGGEVAAMVLLEGCIRLLPGVVGNASTLEEESFGNHQDYTCLLEYPLYTRPSSWKDITVPEELLSGHHKNVERWRLKQAKEITKNRRPDLWEAYKKTKETNTEAI